MELHAPSDNLTLQAPTGGVTRGVPLKIGVILCVPLMTVQEGEQFTAEVKGVWVEFPLKAGDEPAYNGEYAYFDGADFTLTEPVAPNDKPVGAFIKEHRTNALYLPGIL